MLSYDVSPLSGCWKELGQALKLINPLRQLEEQSIDPCGSTEIDVLVIQLSALAAALWFPQYCNQEWPSFVKEMGSKLVRNPSLIRSLRMSYWIGKDSFLPWKKILSSFNIHLLPFVILHLLLSWSEVLLLRDLSTATDYLNTLMEAHSQWIETTYSFVESLSAVTSKDFYPAGQLLDLASLARITVAIQKCLQDAPLKAIRSLQQSKTFSKMEPDFQVVIRQRLST